MKTCQLCESELIDAHEIELETCEDCLDDVESMDLEDQLNTLLG